MGGGAQSPPLELLAFFSLLPPPSPDDFDSPPEDFDSPSEGFDSPSEGFDSPSEEAFDFDFDP